MKFCLSSNQSKEYLQKADEIKIPYKDIDMILDFTTELEGKTFIVDCFNIESIDWKNVDKYNKIAKNNLILCLGNINDMRTAMTMNIRHYFGYPIMSFYELNSILIFDPEYILLDTELFFSMDDVKNFNVKVRAVPNLAYNDNLPRENGICGTWIRPEDLESVYGDYIDAVEFADCDVDKEQALYRIYAEEKEWRTELNLLITNLDAPGVNRMISSEVSERRLNCGQKCQRGASCRICNRAFFLADPDKIKAYQTAIKTTD